MKVRAGGIATAANVAAINLRRAVSQARGGARARGCVASGLLVLMAAALMFSACSEAPLPGPPPPPPPQTTQLRSAGGVGCGNGVWDPEEEACDTGGPTESCSAECAVLTMPAALAEAGVGYRQFGSARHPVAANGFGAAVAFVQAASIQGASPAQSLPPQLGVSLVDALGARVAETLLPGDFMATQLTAPSVVATGEQRYVTASTVLGQDADESGIALHLVQWSGAELSVSGAVIANQQQAFAQSDPDLLWVGGELVVVWVDHSDGSTGPDLRYRVFDESLTPKTDELSLAAELLPEAHVTLSALSGGGQPSWAAAYRASVGPGEEVVRVAAPALGLRWQTDVFTSPSSQDRPALVSLGDGRLLLVYTVQTLNPAASSEDVPLVGQLRLAVLHAGHAVADGAVEDPEAPLSVESCPPSLPGEIFFDASVSQGQPSLTRVGPAASLAWQSAGLPGHPLAQELWQMGVTWPSGVQSCTELGFAGVPVPLLGAQATEAERAADQRRPALAAAGGVSVVAWEEYGSVLELSPGDVLDAVENSPEGDSVDPLFKGPVPDILVRVAPVQVSCSVAEPCGNLEGHCETDEQCEGELKCGFMNGDLVGKNPSLNLCIPCGNGIPEPGEECDEGMQSPSCNLNCTLPFCGDGVVGAAEQCDPGFPGLDTAQCTAQCTLSSCGDGYENPAAGEECEPSTAGQNDAACDSDCTAPACGDGIVNTAAGEACELSDPNCAADCSELIAVPGCGGGGCPKVRSVNLGSPTDGDISLQFRIDHTAGSSGINLGDFSLRYYVEDTLPNAWEFWVWQGYSTVVEGSIQAQPVSPSVPGANQYIHVPLEGWLGAGQLSPTVHLSLHHVGWPNVYEPNDYSYQPGSSLADNPEITLYYQGQLVWGVDPSGGGGPATCGNSVVESGEACDTGGQSASCDADCTTPECGDGEVSIPAGEACDPGDNPACFSDCSGMPCTDPNTCLHLVYNHYPDDSPWDQQIKVSVNVVNNGSTTVNLNNLMLSYWFDHEPAGGGGMTTECDWAGIDGGCGVVAPNLGIQSLNPPQSGADMRWNFGFQNAGSLAPGQSSGAILVHFQNDWWNNLNDTNDYSYIQSLSGPTVTTTITAYLSGNLVWGVEP